MTAGVAPPPLTTLQRFPLNFFQDVRFADRKYTPDLGGLSWVAHLVWSRFVAARPRANVFQSYSESMFIFSIAQTALWILAHKCQSNNKLAEEYVAEPWFMMALRYLISRRVPKFLADWATMIGLFTGPTGATFRPFLPPYDPTISSAWTAQAGYASSLPSFRLLARMMDNDAAGRNLNDFRANPAAPPGAAKNPDIIAPYVRARLPGMIDGIQGAWEEVRSHVGNINDWEYLPVGKAAPTLRHLLQMPMASSAQTWLDFIFDRCADEGLPTTVLDDTILQKEGTAALCYYAEPGEGFPWHEFRMRCISGTYDPVHVEVARLFRPIIVKRPEHTIFAEEDAGRWDVCLVNDDVCATATPFYPISKAAGLADATNHITAWALGG